MAGLTRFFQQEDLNFLLTNRIPRRSANLFMGWFSQIRIPWVKSLSIWLWRKFDTELDLSEAKEQHFASLHECFIRELKDGARPIDPDPASIVSPSDGIIGAHGRLDGVNLIQAKGFPYTLDDLLHDEELVERYRNGLFLTVRIKSSMYHRLHAPCAARMRKVTYISGDTWNVNPIALQRVEKLFCKNERAVLHLEPNDSNLQLTLVPVAAILVGGIRLHCLGEVLDLRYRGPNQLSCDATYDKGEEVGMFQHGSTVILFASGDLEFSDKVVEGARIRMGEPIFSQPLKSVGGTHDVS